MKDERWVNELKELTQLLNDSPLIAEIKWGKQVYTYQNRNVVGLGGFKNYYALWFFDGSLMKDPQQVLINAQESKTKGLRQWRFTAGESLNAPLILVYIEEAMRVIESGVRISRAKTEKLELPALLMNALEKSPLAKEQFNLLSVAKQNEYIHPINEAKKEETKVSRIQKMMPIIEQGLGYYEKYKK